MSKIDYKQKYLEIRNTLIKSVDIAYRQGYEMGMKDAQLKQLQEQQAMMQQMQGSMAPQGASGDEGESAAGPAMYGPQGGAPIEGQVPEPEQPQPGQDLDIYNVGGLQVGTQSELDAHIQALENAINKYEGADTESLKKSLDGLKEYAVKLKAQKKSTKILTPRLAQTMSQAQKSQLSMQEAILNGILEKWEKESQKSVSELSDSLTAMLKKHDH